MRAFSHLRRFLFLAVLGAGLAGVGAAQTVTRFPVPRGSYGLRGIAAGPDGNLWFASADGWIGRMTMAGSVSAFTVPAASPQDIALGPDGNLWFTEASGSRIGRSTTAGVITEFPIPSAHDSHEIAAGADGNLWFTEGSTGTIGRITPTGVITEFSTPSGSGAQGIAAGPDGNIWFGGPSRIGRITTDGIVTEFPPRPTRMRSPPGRTGTCGSSTGRG